MTPTSKQKHTQRMTVWTRMTSTPRDSSGRNSNSNGSRAEVKYVGKNRSRYRSKQSSGPPQKLIHMVLQPTEYISSTSTVSSFIHPSIYPQVRCRRRHRRTQLSFYATPSYLKIKIKYNHLLSSLTIEFIFICKVLRSKLQQKESKEIHRGWVINVSDHSQPRGITFLPFNHRNKSSRYQYFLHPTVASHKCRHNQRTPDTTVSSIELTPISYMKEWYSHWLWV